MSKIENLEKRIKDLEDTVYLLKNQSSVSKTKNISNLENLLTDNILKLKPQDLVILLLYSKVKMTKDEIKSEFKTLGATHKMLNWFNGGNFKKRLVDSGIVFEDEKKENKPLFSLTKGKGNQTAKTIINKLESIS